jgi:hypothetical protein
MAWEVVCVDERAAQPEYDVVAKGAEIHRPIATFYDKWRAERYVSYLNRMDKRYET